MSKNLPDTGIKENGFQVWEFFYLRVITAIMRCKAKNAYMPVLNGKCIKPGELNQGVISIEKCYRTGCRD